MTEPTIATPEPIVAATGDPVADQLARLVETVAVELQTDARGAAAFLANALARFAMRSVHRPTLH